eukprot:Amastigsp_a176903_12.p1 type:complete len:287 gc:universal Amastigsp_a176903_12:1075-215(-)
MHNTGLVDTELDLTGLGVFHGGGDIGRHRSDFRIRHQSAWAKDLAQRADDTHGVRRCDHDIEIHLAGLDVGSQIIHADDVSARSLGFFSLGALCKHGHTFGLAGAIGQHDGATNHLVGFLGIDAKLHGHVDGLIELGDGEFLDQTDCIGHCVQLVAVDLVANGFLAFGQLAHTTPSTDTPMERAVPAIVRTAASRSAAVMSFILVFAISSSCAREILPTFTVCGVAEPLSSLMAFLIRTPAGGVLMTKVKLLSANAVITTGSGRPGSTPWVCALNALQNSMMFKPR